MAAKPETTWYTRMLKWVSPQAYRMKNHNPYVSGVADFWFSGTGGDVWVEIKVLDLPKRDSTPVRVELSALQLDWLGQRFVEGRNVIVVVGVKGSGGVVMTSPQEWARDWTKPEFEARMISVQEIAAFINDLTT